MFFRLWSRYRQRPGGLESRVWAAHERLKDRSVNWGDADGRPLPCRRDLDQRAYARGRIVYVGAVGAVVTTIAAKAFAVPLAGFPTAGTTPIGAWIRRLNHEKSRAATAMVAARLSRLLG
jgi:hypothetical protein